MQSIYIYNVIIAPSSIYMDISNNKCTKFKYSIIIE